MSVCATYLSGLAYINPTELTYMLSCDVRFEAQHMPYSVLIVLEDYNSNNKTRTTLE